MTDVRAGSGGFAPWHSQILMAMAQTTIAPMFAVFSLTYELPD